MTTQHYMYLLPPKKNKKSLPGSINMFLTLIIGTHNSSPGGIIIEGCGKRAILALALFSFLLYILKYFVMVFNVPSWYASFKLNASYTMKAAHLIVEIFKFFTISGFRLIIKITCLGQIVMISQSLRFFPCQKSSRVK